MIKIDKINEMEFEPYTNAVLMDDLAFALNGHPSFPFIQHQAYATSVSILDKGQIRKFDKQASHADIFSSAAKGCTNCCFKIGGHYQRQPDMFSLISQWAPQKARILWKIPVIFFY